MRLSEYPSLDARSNGRIHAARSLNRFGYSLRRMHGVLLSGGKTMKNWNGWMDSAFSGLVLVSMLVWTGFYVAEAMAHAYSANLQLLWT